MKNLLSPKWLIRHTAVLIVFLILINFGLWQLRRLEQRQALNEAVRAGLNQPSVALTGQAVDPEELHRRRVSVSGTYDNDETIVIRNRPREGQPGVHLVVPLRIADSEQAVLVNRGWIPLQAPQPDDLQEYHIEGPVTVEGIAYRSQPRPDGFLVPTDPTPQPGQADLTTWFRIDIERIQEQLPAPLLPIFIEQAPTSDPTPEVPPLSVETLTLDAGPHLGYAIQWFSFALILAVTYALFIRQELRQP